MPKDHPKRQFLEEVGALHRHPDRIRAELFERHRFFDPLDKVQVKYEMLRAHAIDRRSVVTVAAEFGFSRETYYAVLSAFQARGVPGLADGKAGRPGPLKLTDDAAEWVWDLHRRAPDLSGREIAERLAGELGVEVHRRTIERLLGAGGKKNGGRRRAAADSTGHGRARTVSFGRGMAPGPV
ncbi:MAG: helix-turn-helix domain-containing protein [Candidatus Methylomirabilis sp.]